MAWHSCQLPPNHSRPVNVYFKRTESYSVGTYDVDMGWFYPAAAEADASMVFLRQPDLWCEIPPLNDVAQPTWQERLAARGAP
jgi:hypothetical protein